MKISRRSVLAASASTPALAGVPAFAANQRVAIVTEIGNPAANSPPVNNALNKLRQALTEQGAFVETVAGATAGTGFALVLAAPGIVLVLAAPGSALASGFSSSGASMAAEQFRIAPGKWSGMNALLVSAGDIRGFVYGLLELAERVGFSGLAALRLKQEISDQPANRVRSLA